MRFMRGLNGRLLHFVGTILTFVLQSGDYVSFGGKRIYFFTTAITANVTETDAPAGSIGVTTNSTGRSSIFVSDASKWQAHLAVTALEPGVTVAALTVTGQKSGYAYIQNVAAASTTGGADQLDLNAVAEPSTMANIVQPDVPRNVVVNFTDANASIDAFSFTVAGTAQDGSAVSETFLFAGGLDQVGSKIFAKITSFTLTSINGNGAGDTLDVGYGVKFGVPLPAGSTSLSIVKLVSNGTEEAASATDTTNNSFTATTAPDGSKDYEVWYEYIDPTEAAIISGFNALRTSLIDAGVIAAA